MMAETIREIVDELKRWTDAERLTGLTVGVSQIKLAYDYTGPDGEVVHMKKIVGWRAVLRDAKRHVAWQCDHSHQARDAGRKETALSCAGREVERRARAAAPSA